MTIKDIEAEIRNLLVVRFPSSADLDSAFISTDHVSVWDSMAQVDIVVGLEQLFSIEADSSLVEARSLRELVSAVERLLKKTASTSV